MTWRLASFLAIRIRASQNGLIPLHRLLGSTVEEGSAAADDDYDYDDGSDDDGDDDDDDDDDGDGDGDSDCWVLQNMGDAYLGLGSATSPSFGSEALGNISRVVVMPNRLPTMK